jgi:hypothetical protein
MSFRRTHPAALIVLTLAGCGDHKGLATYSATGKVVYTTGEPMTGGTVQFQPQKDASVSTFAEIGKDGTFSLSTLADGKKTAGALEGPQRVTIIPPLGPDQSVHPVTLPDLVTVKPDGGNDFTLTIPHPR